ncbi:MAG: hypothetical protein RL026_1944 [Pseudomonadota bacterium]
MVTQSEAVVHCLDCGAAVSGKFCAECGQSRDVHLRSVHELLHDVTHTLTHTDSRLWRTLRTLLLQPGQLSRAWCAGQHARFIPPFRLYLVVSALFFALIAVLPAAMPDPGGAGMGTTGTGAAVEFSDGNGCEVTANVQLPGLPDAAERLRRTCEQAQRDGGRQFLARLRSDAPTLLFCLVPFAAIFASLLYWRPRRRYIEHLVFGLHSQTVLFVLLSIGLGVEAVSSATGVPAAPVTAVGFGLAFALVWYLYTGMRTFYGQGRLRTLAKLATMAAVHAVLLLTLSTLGMIHAALTPAP